MSHTWQVTCPHCRERQTLDENGVGAGHLKAGLALLRSPDGVRELIENHTILCLRCGKPMPFEPRSRYRRRKAMAVQERLEELGRLQLPDTTGRRALGLALKLGEVLHRALQSDYPLDEIRAMVDESARVLEAETFPKEPELRRHPAMQSLLQMMAIARADVGELDDLPEAPADDLEEKGRVLIKAVEELRKEVAPPPKEKGVEGGWIERAKQQGNAAPYSIRIPYGGAPAFPKVCAGCGEAAVEQQPMARGATDETTMLLLPVCAACFKEGNGAYWKRKLKMGCATLFGMAGIFGGMAAESMLIAGVGCALVVVAFLVGSGAGGGQPVPLLKRRPYIRFHARSMELFASTGFIQAVYDAHPELRHVK